MKWILVALAVMVLAGCARKIYVQSETDHSGILKETVTTRIKDTVMVAERCTLRIMPEGTSSVVHREIQRVRIVRDTVNIVRTDTVRVAKAVAPRLHTQPAHRWVWVMMGGVLTLFIIAVSRRILRRFL